MNRVRSASWKVRWLARPVSESVPARSTRRACASELSIAIPTSSANRSIRSSASAGSPAVLRVLAITAPQTTPDTRTGAATDAWNPSRRATRVGTSSSSPSSR